ncbi:hypothetical protein EVAR_23328_1 [Eumeta japonica]|uniref:Uncharacterized protein n=1 Tax=Eumeta variegata TaxID=151549 RepID=A0A4C1Y0W4_EUMVA|nr:hypothetical protein EVAR_23328_1 [Eumeta japonica]
MAYRSGIPQCGLIIILFFNLRSRVKSPSGGAGIPTSQALRRRAARSWMCQRPPERDAAGARSALEVCHPFGSPVVRPSRSGLKLDENVAVPKRSCYRLGGAGVRYRNRTRARERHIARLLLRMKLTQHNQRNLKPGRGRRRGNRARVSAIGAIGTGKRPEVDVSAKERGAAPPAAAVVVDVHHFIFICYSSNCMKNKEMGGRGRVAPHAPTTGKSTAGKQSALRRRDTGRRTYTNIQGNLLKLLRLAFILQSFVKADVSGELSVACARRQGRRDADPTRAVRRRANRPCSRASCELPRCRENGGILFDCASNCNVCL